ncbi:3-keto-disaccharide hydrolase [Maribacter sp. CXY002]|uniref:3-keto-disaccharide hydrolase n=1 Tax=Maribacter luteocoastalis TaxID=3407671 RepID=UPI003B67DD47
MKKVIVVIIMSVSAMNLVAQINDGQMETIFNGQDLDHWNIPEDNIWWSIENQVLWARSDVNKLGSALWTKKEYTDFVVELDFKFGEGTVDTGIFMRGEAKEFVQIQIGESGSLKRDMTASPYVPTLGYPVEANGVAELLKVDDWNTIKAEVVGDNYKVWLNGVEVMTYILKNAKPSGPIGLQLHPGKDMTVQFKNISVIEL